MHDLAIIGAGPGGYVAAIRAAQLGGNACLIEKDELGGTCLNWGCIPTKTLAASAELLSKAKVASDFGIDVQSSTVNFARLMARKEEVVQRLRKGVEALLKARKVTVIKGVGKLLDEHNVEVGGDKIEAKNIIIATGSRPLELRDMKFDGKRVLSSKDLLDIKSVPDSLLIVGGGVIGCEFASIFAEFGTKVTIVEMLDRLLPNGDRELGKKLEVIFKKKGLTVYTKTKLAAVDKAGEGLVAKTEDGKEIRASKILIAVGRTFNTEDLGLEKLGIQTEKGKVLVDSHLSTKVKNIFAIGDCIGGSLLAHVASHEGIVAAENIFSDKKDVNYDFVPSCIFTHPQIASCGLTEEKAKEAGLGVKVGKFPFQALGKAHAVGETDGFVKIVADEKTGKIIGAQIMGGSATDIIQELVLAMRHKLTAEELGDAICAHPTMPEAISEAAAAVSGQAIHIQ